MKTLPTGARRRRLLTRTLPLAIVALVAFVLGASAGAPGSPEKEAAERFAAAWERGDLGAMYRELNAPSRRATGAAEFAAAYRTAAQVATLRGVEAQSPRDPVEADGKDLVAVPVEATTLAFGTIVLDLDLPFAEGGIAWQPHLVFPGLAPGEHLENELDFARRTPVLARDGKPLAEEPGGPREHLEEAFDPRLAGRPGGSLLAVADIGGSARILAQAEPRPGAPVRTTIDPELQAAAAAALGGRAGGVAVLDARNGDVRALAGQAFSAPQPPGSTFKVITTAAALQEGAVSLADTFEIGDGINVGGRFISNANGELCGGTFREAFAHSCNAVFAPLGPAVGNDDLVAAAERFGFNSPPTLYAGRIAARVEPAESTLPAEIGDDLDLGVSAIGQGEVLATPLLMASVAQAVAAGGVRAPTSIVANPKLRPEQEPVRVMSRQVAGTLGELMVAVVTEGTGFAAAIPEAQVAGKTGTAELGPAPGQEDAEEPEQIKDAWFIAFAPAEKPRLAVGVMLIEAEASGGEVAAPIAAEVLAAGI